MYSVKKNYYQQPKPMATAAAAAAAPGLLTQVGMAGGAAVITVSYLNQESRQDVPLRMHSTTTVK
jgi:hypothetical protein